MDPIQELVDKINDVRFIIKELDAFIKKNKGESENESDNESENEPDNESDSE